MPILDSSNSTANKDVFKSCLLLMLQNEYLWSKGLTLSKQQNSRLVQIESICRQPINPLPDNKILDWSKLKQIADNILNAFKM